MVGDWQYQFGWRSLTPTRFLRVFVRTTELGYTINAEENQRSIGKSKDNWGLEKIKYDYTTVVEGSCVYLYDSD